VVPDHRRGAPAGPAEPGFGSSQREASRADPGGPGPGRLDEPLEPPYEMMNGFVPLIVNAVNGVLVQLPLLRP
jgi:hypothetical protein